MGARDVIVVGASAGGVQALISMVGGLPADLPAAVLVVLHIPPTGAGALPAILERAASLPVQTAIDGEDLRPGRVYVAPPDHHLLVAPGRVLLSRGPREGGHRPAVDPLFRSAADVYGPRVIGVVLSGALDDGTSGLAAIVERGGVAVVQDPADALHASMPLSAIENINVHHVVPATQLGALLALQTQGAPTVSVSAAGPPPPAGNPVDLPRLGPDSPGADPSPIPAGLSCPDCHGSLYEMHAGDVVHYRCRVGHAFGPKTLLTRQTDGFEAALWLALRTLEDKTALCRRMSRHAAERGAVRTAARYAAAASAAEQAAYVIRDVLHAAGAVAGADFQAAGEDAGPDTGQDAGPDAGPDTGQGAGQDAGPDTGPGAGQDDAGRRATDAGGRHPEGAS